MPSRQAYCAPLEAQVALRLSHLERSLSRMDFLIIYEVGYVPFAEIFPWMREAVGSKKGYQGRLKKNQSAEKSEALNLIATR